MLITITATNATVTIDGVTEIYPPNYHAIRCQHCGRRNIRKIERGDRLDTEPRMVNCISCYRIIIWARGTKLC